MKKLTFPIFNPILSIPLAKSKYQCLTLSLRWNGNTSSQKPFSFAHKNIFINNSISSNSHLQCFSGIKMLHKENPTLSLSNCMILKKDSPNWCLQIHQISTPIILSSSTRKSNNSGMHQLGSAKLFQNSTYLSYTLKKFACLYVKKKFEVTHFQLHQTK